MIGIVMALVMRGDLHRRRRRRDQQVQLGLLPLRPVPDLHGRQAGQGGRRGRGRRVRGEPRSSPSSSGASRPPRSGTARALFIKRDAQRMITPMFIVIVTLGTTDLLFALDSIPAIFGITKEPYLVLTANIFALMGLRQLYFLIGGLLQRLIYLSYGLAFLLAFIGVKLILHAMHENELPFINGGEHIDVGPGDPDLALARRHPRHAGGHRRACRCGRLAGCRPRSRTRPPARAATGKTTEPTAPRRSAGRRDASYGVRVGRGEGQVPRHGRADVAAYVVAVRTAPRWEPVGRSVGLLGLVGARRDGEQLPRRRWRRSSARRCRGHGAGPRRCGTSSPTASRCPSSAGAGRPRGWCTRCDPWAPSWSSVHASPKTQPPGPARRPGDQDTHWFAGRWSCRSRASCAGRGRRVRRCGRGAAAWWCCRGGRCRRGGS